MSASEDYKLDIGELADSVVGESSTTRPWVGIRFDCCGVYTRVYRRHEQQVYQGRCPRCGRGVRLKVGPEGTPARFFIAQ